jgi:hypothetical protein
MTKSVRTADVGTELERRHDAIAAPDVGRPAPLAPSDPLNDEPDWVIVGHRRPDGTVRVVASNDMASATLVPVAQRHEFASWEQFKAAFRQRLELQLTADVRNVHVGNGATYREAMNQLFTTWRPAEPE